MCGDDQRPDHDVDAHSFIPSRARDECTLLNTLIGNFVVVYEEEDILYEMMWRDGKGRLQRLDWMMASRARGRGERARKGNAEEELSMRETEGNGASRDSFSFRYFTRFDAPVTDVWMNGGGEAPRVSSFRRREEMRRRRRR